MTVDHTYKNSGVDTQKSDQIVEYIKKSAQSTEQDVNNNIIAGVGGFASLFSVDLKKYKDPVIASCTDGVGTKLLVARDCKMHKGIGVDLVAMCVNDLLCHGADPLFFLDYYATGCLDLDTSKEILDSIIKGCKIAKIPLLGGETAEMPGLYKKNDYDLAGFAVGIAQRGALLPQKDIKSGDQLIGLKSSGLHANGFSLVRKIFESLKIDYCQSSPWGNKTWVEVLLEPTFIYSDLLSKVRHLVKGVAHITGGGILENLQRILPKNLKVNFEYKNWPELFCWIMKEGDVAEQEMLSTFNCGIGMILVTDKKSAIIDLLPQDAFCIGQLV